MLIQSRPASTTASLCADLAVIGSTLWLAHWLRGPDNVGIYLQSCLVAFLLYPTISAALPIRSQPGMATRLQALWPPLAAWACTLVLMLVVAWMAKVTADYSRVVVGSWALFGAVGLLGWRGLGHLATRGAATDKRPAVIAGASDRARRFARQFQSAPPLEATLAGCFSGSKQAVQEASADDLSVPVLGDLDDLVKRARKGEFSTIFVAMRPEEEETGRQLVAALCDTPTSVYVVPSAHAEELAQARWVDYGGMPLVSIFETPYSGVNGWIKRVEDLLFATFMLLAAAVPMLAIAAAVRLTSPGPALFSQRRHGIDGREIRILKFRTMTVLEDGGAISQAVRGDSRYTPIGAFLRRTSLDELPQIFNVLRGEMSVVGPRPHAVSVNEQYRKLIPGYMLRHRVRPGITGWAQIHGLRGSDTLQNMEKRVRYDLWYLTRWSVWLDLWIVARSIPALAGHRNAF